MGLGGNKLFLIILLVTMVASKVHAKNLILLTSLDAPISRLNSIEKRFIREHQGLDVNLIAKHQARPYDLYRAIRDPDTVGLIWISHSAQGNGSSYSNLKSAHVISDMWGNDVKKFFTTVSPNLKMLSILGCESLSIMEDYAEKGFYSDNLGLKVFAFKEKVRLSAAVRSAFRKGKNFLKRQLRNNTPARSDIDGQEPSVSLRAQELTQTQNPPDYWLELGDKVLSMRSAEEAYASPNAKLSLRYLRSLPRTNIKQVADRSFGRSELPILSMSIDDTAWEVFSLPNGTPIGRHNSYLYLSR